jgi:hypothetical protein
MDNCLYIPGSFFDIPFLPEIAPCLTIRCVKVNISNSNNVTLTMNSGKSNIEIVRINSEIKFNKEINSSEKLPFYFFRCKASLQYHRMINFKVILSANFYTYTTFALVRREIGKGATLL